eukprot:364824-Amphidinium_carterae.1
MVLEEIIRLGGVKPLADLLEEGSMEVTKRPECVVDVCPHVFRCDVQDLTSACCALAQMRTGTGESLGSLVFPRLGEEVPHSPLQVQIVREWWFGAERHATCQQCRTAGALVLFVPWIDRGNFDGRAAATNAVALLAKDCLVDASSMLQSNHVDSTLEEQLYCKEITDAGALPKLMSLVCSEGGTNESNAAACKASIAAVSVVHTHAASPPAFRQLGIALGPKQRLRCSEALPW